ncbi:MAG: SDR family NAD(P)-dependent oxidoreductase [Actinobacteria bacterium]|nr:SDR family NAD(P)-dependent oxidoreductase [Actinomycetota bacterium]MSZ37298.1 SDR family NAD(P)-dependent oxidoreductase [Actinomycetota bacterium]MTA00054.1 SDR family NAD(P)-dependent oxidoreductase [Actinomycetota bacterium]MTA10391.1 SDR family NAD(P)-dependent oxidoreductase [Actinomycetota bacterium]MTA68995.1 SDR family NAD(P)-dependent oxidoreductase [Actinomycetota bacterium]
MDGHRLDGKIALVTGASRGIGAAIARRLASEGATVACMARTLDPDPRYEGTLRDTVEMITSNGGQAAPFKADLSSAEDRKKLIDDVHAELGPIDILVNNAAVTFLLPIDSFPEKRFKLMIETQVWGAIDLAQQVIPDMRQRGSGWILNISSRAAVKPVGPPFEAWFATGNSSVYGLCKAALERVSLGMAAELYADNIAVNTLAPWDNVITPGAGAHDLLEGFVIESEEIIAQAALELCSGQPKRLTGRVAYSQALLAEMGISPQALTGGPFP